MITVYKKGEYEVLKYSPSIIHPFYDNMDPLSLFSRIRFFIEYFYGYDVYYLKRDGIIVGYCTVSSGRNTRYWFADERDIIFGPYFIKEEYRGLGLSRILIDIVLNSLGINYRYAYDYIDNKNIPSIRVTQRLGGIKVFNVNINVITRQMRKSQTGQYGIYRIAREKDT